MYHLILGLVIGSSLAIFPTVVFPAFRADALAAAGFSLTGAVLFAVVMFVAGVVMSYYFSKLESNVRGES